MNIRMLREDEVRIPPPSPLLLLLEGRGFAEMVAFPLRALLLRGLPRGDGHPVLVIPGLGADDRSTAPLRSVLQGLGYAAYGWELGRNLGMRSHIRAALAARPEALHRLHGLKVSLIGWSLGGVYARELARHTPEHVRRVITLGSPINGRPDANNAAAFFNFFNRRRIKPTAWDEFQRRRIPPPVPCTAIFSKQDGIVGWQCAQEEPAPNTENIEVRGTHLGLGFNPQVIRVVAGRLALPEPV